MTEYEITSDKTRLDVVAIHAFLSQTYWSPGIPLATVQKAIDHSLTFGVYLGAEQVGFARVITDKTTFAYLADVYILDAHRGKGLAKRLVASIQAHAELQGLRRFLLATKDAHGLYEQFGFKPLLNPTRMMEVLNPNTYTAGA